MDEYLSNLANDYNKTLREQPDNIKLWLEFIQFQDTYADKFAANVKKKALIERKIAIYERALEVNPTSMELILGHMQLCAEIWDNDQLEKKWKKLTFTHPNRSILWRYYLIYCQARFSSFATTRCISFYDKGLDNLSNIMEGNLASHLPEPNAEEGMIKIFLQRCSFLHQVGQTEKAIACFQALIEFNCFCRSEIRNSSTLKGQIAFFETYWDSNVARFGETGATGWHNWMTKIEVKVSNA